MNRHATRLLVFAVVFALAPMLAPAQSSPELQKVDVSVGRWVFHGKTLNAKTGKPGSFTWNEDCRWSSNHLYLDVVDTYNTADHSYWHYELYASGEKGNDPFISRMEINGNTWIEHGRDVIPGKQAGERIVYNWTPPDRVHVAIETSTDGVHWTATNEGEGIKQ